MTCLIVIKKRKGHLHNSRIHRPLTVNTIMELFCQLDSTLPPLLIDTVHIYFYINHPKSPTIIPDKFTFIVATF